MSIEEIRFKLVHTATEYDRTQETKKYYNPYALSQYFAATERVLEEVQKGVSVRQALLNNFQGRLLDSLLKAVGEAKFTKEERLAQ